VTRARAAVAAVAFAVLLAGCGSGGSAPGAGGSTPSRPETPASSPSQSRPVSPSRTPSPSRHGTKAPSTATSAAVSKLLVFVVENHSMAEMRAQMPWTYALAQHYGYATDYRAMTHPSLPNYLAIAGGSTFGVTDDANPSAHPAPAPSVFGAALRAGLTARVYADAMPSPCFVTSVGDYAVRHNPWTYFPSEHAECLAHDLTMAPYAADVRSGHLPDAGLVVPDLCHDAHDCSLATADAWLREEVGLAMTGPDFRSGRLAIVVTADEDDGTQGNTVLTVVVHPSQHGAVVTSPLSQLSLSRLYAEVLGVPPLRDAASAPSMASAFHLPLLRS
jgi:phosphatidylinositol-3-phosphatase